MEFWSYCQTVAVSNYVSIRMDRKAKNDVNAEEAHGQGETGRYYCICISMRNYSSLHRVGLPIPSAGTDGLYNQ